MLGRAREKTKSINDLDSEQVTKKSKVLARVMDEYFRRDKVFLSYLCVLVSHYYLIALTSFYYYIGVFSYAR